jgi:hypothetical protein
VARIQSDSLTDVALPNRQPADTQCPYSARTRRCHRTLCPLAVRLVRKSDTAMIDSDTTRGAQRHTMEGALVALSACADAIAEGGLSVSTVRVTGEQREMRDPTMASDVELAVKCITRSRVAEPYAKRRMGLLPRRYRHWRYPSHLSGAKAVGECRICPHASPSRKAAQVTTLRPSQAQTLPRPLIAAVDTRQ